MGQTLFCFYANFSLLFAICVFCNIVLKMLILKIIKDILAITYLKFTKVIRKKNYKNYVYPKNSEFYNKLKILTLFLTYPYQ